MAIAVTLPLLLNPVFDLRDTDQQLQHQPSSVRGIVDAATAVFIASSFGFLYAWHRPHRFVIVCYMLRRPITAAPGKENEAIVPSDGITPSVDADFAWSEIFDEVYTSGGGGLFVH